MPERLNGGRLNRPRILLADDHQLMLELVAALLQSKFDVVGAAHTGREMIAEVMRLNPDLIVSDISMPELSGIDAARHLREKGSMAKLVFLTADVSDEFLDACLAEGALGYVVKSRIETDLIPAINSALAGRCFISRRGQSTQPR